MTHLGTIRPARKPVDRGGARGLRNLGTVVGLLCALVLPNGPVRAQDAAEEWQALRRQIDAAFLAKRFDEAGSLAERQLALARQSFGEADGRTQLTLVFLAELLGQQGKPAEAEPLFREALQGSREALGPQHPSTKAVADDLGLLLRRQGRLEEAERLRLGGPVH